MHTILCSSFAVVYTYLLIIHILYTYRWAVRFVTYVSVIDTYAQLIYANEHNAIITIVYITACA